MRPTINNDCDIYDVYRCTTQIWTVVVHVDVFFCWANLIGLIPQEWCFCLFFFLPVFTRLTAPVTTTWSALMCETLTHFIFWNVFLHSNLHGKQPADYAVSLEMLEIFQEASEGTQYANASFSPSANLSAVRLLVRTNCNGESAYFLTLLTKTFVNCAYVLS